MGWGVGGERGKGPYNILLDTCRQKHKESGDTVKRYYNDILAKSNMQLINRDKNKEIRQNI